MSRHRFSVLGPSMAKPMPGAAPPGYPLRRSMRSSKSPLLVDPAVLAGFWLNGRIHVITETLPAGLQFLEYDLSAHDLSTLMAAVAITVLLFQGILRAKSMPLIPPVFPAYCIRRPFSSLLPPSG